MTLAADIVAAIRADPDALAELRALMAPTTPVAAATVATAYTVPTLAAELGRSERSVRAAIARGELDAVKRGRGWLVSADAVERWASAPRGNGRSSSVHARRRRSSVMRDALDG